MIKSFQKERTLFATVPSAIISILFASIVNPFSFMKVQSFDRVISYATSNNYNVSMLIFGFFLMFFVFVIGFILSYLFFNYLLQRYKRQADVLKFFKKYIIVMGVTVANFLIIFFTKCSSQPYETASLPMSIVILIIGLGMILLYLLFGLNKKIKFKHYVLLVINIFVFGFMLGLASQRLFDNVVLIWMMMCLVTFLFIKFSKKQNYVFISRLTMFMAIATVIVPIFMEVINIMNQYNIYIASPITLYRVLLVIICVAIILAVILPRHKNRQKNINRLRYTRFIYPVLIFGVALLHSQLTLTQEYTPDLLETANSSVLISDTIYYGKIPIVDHYGGHMLSGYLGGIVYGILNSDSSGAIFSPYAVYMTAILFLIFFYVIKNTVDDDTAFLATLFVPSLLGYFRMYGIAMLAVLALIAFMKKRTYLKAFLVVFLVIISALYRLDIGVATAIAIIVSTILYAIYFKTNIRKIVIVTIVSTIVLGGIWVVLSLMRGNNPFSRLWEFISISGSNQNWASSETAGNTDSFIYVFSYMLLPLSIAIATLYLLIPQVARKYNKKLWLILIVLGVAYFANFPRGIVRHNLTEMNTTIIYWTGFLFLSLFISSKLRKKQLVMPIYFGLTVLATILVSGKITGTMTNLADGTIDNSINIRMDWKATNFKQKAERVKVTTAAKKETEDLAKVLLPLLKENETFFDFTNRSYYYSALKKQDPVYAAQTPCHLSGLYAQEAAIDDIKRNNVPAVIMPPEVSLPFVQDLDGIQNSLRYYKLAEFIYKEYRPLVQYDLVSIWVRNDVYDSAKNTLEQLFDQGVISQEKYKITESYTMPRRKYGLGSIPVLWAEKDKRNASNNEVVSKVDCASDAGISACSFDLDFDMDEGNYILIKMSSENDRLGNISFGFYDNGEYNEEIFYDYDVLKGQHAYLFRISNDYAWHEKKINIIRGDFSDAEITILKGD